MGGGVREKQKTGSSPVEHCSEVSDGLTKQPSMGTQLREPSRAFFRGQRWSRTGHAQCASPHEIFLMPDSFHFIWGLVCGWTSLSSSMPSRKRTSPSFLWLAVRPSCPFAWKSYRGRSILGHLNRWGLRWGFLKFGRRVGRFSQAWI